MRNFLIAAPLALLAAGCTTSLQTGRAPSGIAKGYTYQLPRLAYDVEVTRALTHCPDVSDPALKFEATARAVSRTTPGETIVIDYLSLANGFKTSDITFKSHPNGMLQSVNLTVNDRTADIVKEGIKAVVGLGKIAIGLPGGGMAAAGPDTARPPYLRCTKAAREALDGIPGQKAKVGAAEGASKKAAKALADFEASHPETPRSAQVAAQASKLIAASRIAAAALDEAREAVAKAQSTLTLVARHALELDDNDPVASPLAAAQDGKTKPSTVLEIHVVAAGKREIVIPLGAQLEPDFDAFTSSGWGAGEVGQAAAARGLALLKTGPGKAAIDNALAILPQMDVQMVAGPLVQQFADTTLPVAQVCAADQTDCGVLYRTPAAGRLRICWRPNGRVVTRDECFRAIATDKHVLFAEDRTVPQFGRLASLPFRNGTFANNTLVAEFAEDGRIVTVSYKKPTSEVQAALASVNDGVGGLTDLLTYANGAALRKLQEQKTINEAILTEQESRAKLTPTEVEQLTRQTSLIDAQIALAGAQTRAQPSQVTAIDNERLLIEAQIRRAQKLIELRKLEAELAASSEPSDSPAE